MNSMIQLEMHNFPFIKFGLTITKIMMTKVMLEDRL